MVGKFVLGNVPVFTVLFFRYFISASVLLIILRKTKMKQIEKKDYKYIILIGVAGYFLSVGAQLVGIKLSNASVASLVNSMNPIAITFFAAIILKEKLTIKKIICVIFAVAGVYIIIGGVKTSGQILGIIFSVSSVILWSIASVAVRKITQKYPSLLITTYGMIVAVLCTMPISTYELLTTPKVSFNWIVILSLLYMGLVCTALAYVLWNKSLSMLEAGTCSLFYPVQPMVSVLFGFIFLGEMINVNFIFGAILIVGGVLINILGKREA